MMILRHLVAWNNEDTVKHAVITIKLRNRVKRKAMLQNYSLKKV
jgi:accessory gene regulator protein AgrB